MNLNPFSLLRALYTMRYVHFFAVGVTSVLLNVVTTALLTEFFFGRENYFSAFLIGLGVSIVYSFILHTIVTFKTKGNHLVRLGIFGAYALALAYLQAQTVKWVVSLLGVDWYLPVIVTVILVYSSITFILFKFVLFKNEEDAV